MKTKFLYIAALALCLVACEKETPFDTQSPDDAPQILKPYNESWTGSFNHVLKDASTPLIDSVTVTPSQYTTVNWIVDGTVVQTGLKINMCFAAGVHEMVIEAVTTAGKRTERRGHILVYGDPKQVWTGGPVNLDWKDGSIKVTKDALSKVPEGAKIRIYFSALEDQDYYALRIIPGTSWGDEAKEADNVLVKTDMKDQATPFSFEWNALRKGLVDSKGSMSLVGNGLQILLIDYE